MAEQTASKVPQIRFKGFEGEWEIRILGDEPGEIIAGGDVEKHKLCERGKYPVLANALQNQGILGFYKDDFRVKAPAVTVTGRGDVGHATVRETDFTPVVRLLSVKSSHNVYFLKESINNHKVLVESTGVPQLTVPQFSKYRIWFPRTIREENKIGEYFRELNSLIGLHQRKHDKLVTLKKAMLQKMFPQPGATTPEIRFKGFSGNWDEKMLGSVANVTTGKLDANAMTTDGIYDFYTSGIKKYKIGIAAFTGPAITIAGNGATVGYMHLADGEFNAYQRTYVLNNFTADRSFLFYSTRIHLPKKISEEARTGNIPYIVMDMLTELWLSIPSPAEQQKIGTYFRTLDSLISKHTTQLQKLQQIKSACLEKMFV